MVMAGAGPVSFFAVVYDDGSVYTKQFAGPFAGRPKYLPVSCGGAASFRYVTLYDFQKFREEGSRTSRVSRRRLAALRRQAKNGVWKYHINVLSYELTDNGVGCNYLVVSASDEAYTELRLLGYAALRLSIIVTDPSLAELRAWAMKIVGSLPLEERLP